MEDQKNVNFMRLMSDESIQSTLSSDSYEYYQTEIFDLLPSVQASRPEQDRHGALDANEVYGGAPGSAEDSGHGVGTRDKTSLQPLRNLALCMQGKRGARERRKMQISNIGFWESWRRSQANNRRRVWVQMGEVATGLLPWRHTLHKIQGKFGVGVKAYFIFLRYLIYLNLLHCLLIGGFIIGPTLYYSNRTEHLRFEENDSVLDTLLGSGFLDRSPVFFGFYEPGSLNLPCLNTPLLYRAGILTIFFLSLIMVVRRTIVGYKHTWLLGKRYSMNVSFKIFCGWDFNIQDPSAAALKHSFIRNDLKLFLEEQSFSLRKAQRTLGQKVLLYLLRFILNIIVISLLGGAFCLIYLSSKYLETTDGHGWLAKLVLQYLPPITITFVNLVLPHIFRKISSFEDYSLTVQVNTTLVRSIFLKLASLGIFLVFVFKSNTNQQTSQCRENQFGREMYKLCIFNFLATFSTTFLLNYPRKLLQEKYPTSLLARLSGKQRFLIPFNVLDLVYIQTVSWVGVYYCPLLPLIGIITLVFTFYIKKFSVLRCCVAEQRMFRASSSSVLFYFMLLLSLFMAAAALVFDFYHSKEKNMTFCGPFLNEKTVFNVTEDCVSSLPSSVQNTLRYLASEAFALPLILAEIIILTSYVSRGRANQKAIERLKDMLVVSNSDKRFLVKEHATLLRSRKNVTRSPSEGRPVSVDRLQL
ncbi:transmembrane channel-like protein 7 isoform X1 [Kryptolebias marmoratus]|uniref:transmembrane channel-like protein 7 isoform X1 n=1 Tax=Kryptolebias marmoratus TaxID=37003 RepID=UPI0007F8F51C|nr:transmembrane channel-like protein 7 isoform X1 [Kryptolebias marmoratus]